MADHVRAVIFDLDGVIIDSEPVWENVRRDYVNEHGGDWQPDSQHRMMGMSTGEWSRFVADDLHVDKDAPTIADEVIERMAGRYTTDLPALLPGAVDTVRTLADHYPLGLASSSPRVLIDAVLAATGLTGAFTVTRSTEEEQRGKPAPDVYLAVATALGVPPDTCVAVEDSNNGVRAAAAAGMIVVAIPQAAFALADDVAELPARILPNLTDLPTTIRSLSAP